MKTKSIKKILVLMLALLLASVNLMPAFASYGLDEIYIGNTSVSKGGYWVTRNGNLAEGTEDNFNVSYDAEYNILTLKNAVINTADNSRFGVNAGIAANGPLNIMLDGNNEINIISDTYGSDSENAAIHCINGDVAIFDSGSLAINFNGKSNARGISCESGRVIIDYTSVSFNGTAKSRNITAYSIVALNARITGSEINVNLNGFSEAFGIFAVPENCMASIDGSDISMKFTDCNVSFGFNIYEVDIKNSNISVRSEGGRNTTYGIFAYLFSCVGSNIKLDLTGTSGTGSAIAYNTASINGKRGTIPTGIMSATISPNNVSYSVYYINSMLSIYNPFEGVYGGYFITKNGTIKNGTSSNWNIHFDQQTNTLTLKDAVLDTPLRIIGCANIVLIGENKINFDQTPAIHTDIVQKFSGSGSLTASCANNQVIFANELITFDDNVIVTASTQTNGRNATEFDSLRAAEYHWICIQGTEEAPDEPGELSFWQKIVNFFKKIFDFLFGWIG